MTNKSINFVTPTPTSLSSSAARNTSTSTLCSSNSSENVPHSKKATIEADTLSTEAQIVGETAATSDDPITDSSGALTKSAAASSSSSSSSSTPSSSAVVTLDERLSKDVKSVFPKKRYVIHSISCYYHPLLLSSSLPLSVSLWYFLSYCPFQKTHAHT